jgi:hypothetical protein
VELIRSSAALTTSTADTSRMRTACVIALAVDGSVMRR